MPLASDTEKRHAWEEPKRAAESPRAAGVLLDSYTRAGEDLRDREAHLRSEVTSAEQAGGKKENLYRALHRLGLHLETEGALDQAERSLRRAVDLCDQSSEMSRSHAAALNDHGVILARLGRREEAEEKFSLAIEISQRDEYETVTLTVQRNRGLISWAAGDSNAALDIWNMAFRLARESDDAKANAQILNNVAVLVLLEEKGDEALQLLNRAVLLGQRAGDVRGLACMYNNLGLIFSGFPRGDHIAAIPFLEMALALLSGSVDILARLYVLNNNIIVYEQAHLEPARKFRVQFAETLKSFPFAYPSRLADVEQTIFAKNRPGSAEEETAEREWDISAYPALLCSCSRCGVQSE
jgi:tetratricopeptide (TPR) repeat protein